MRAVWNVLRAGWRGARPVRGWLYFFAAVLVFIFVFAAPPVELRGIMHVETQGGIGPPGEDGT